MPRTLLRLGQYLLIAAMFFALGGHWLVLQTVAWGGMIVDYSRGARWTEAVEKTFDGQHPCGMCKSIASTRQTEKKHEAFTVVKKIDVFHQAVVVFVGVATECWEQEIADVAANARAEQPAVPPPRFA